MSDTPRTSTLTAAHSAGKLSDGRAANMVEGYKELGHLCYALERELAEKVSALSDAAKQIDELKGGLIDQTVRADEAQASESIAHLAMERLRAYAGALREVLAEVVEISDRDHDAWNLAKALLAKNPSPAASPLQAEASPEASGVGGAGTGPLDAFKPYFGLRCARCPECVHETCTKPSVHDWVEGYEFRFDEGGGYTPTEEERAMLEDAITGYLDSRHQSGTQPGTYKGHAHDCGLFSKVSPFSKTIPVPHCTCGHQVNREVEVLRYERDVARAHRDRLADILTAIHAQLASPGGFEREGKVYTFEPLNKETYWPVHQALCARIRAIPDELTAAAVECVHVAGKKS